MKHATWTNDGGPVHCSCCGYSPSYSLNKDNGNFCPSCGADMRNITAARLKAKIIDYLVEQKVTSQRGRSQCGSFEPDRKAQLTGQYLAYQDVLQFVESIEVHNGED